MQVINEHVTKVGDLEAEISSLNDKLDSTSQELAQVSATLVA